MTISKEDRELLAALRAEGLHEEAENLERALGVLPSVSIASPAANDLTRPGLQVGETFENDLWRLHRYSGHLSVMSLIGAGKRGARVVEFLLLGKDNGRDKPYPLMDAAIQEVLTAAADGASVQAMRTLLLRIAKESPEGRWGPELSVDEEPRMGTLVPPANVETINIITDVLSLRASPKEFLVKDLTDYYCGRACMERGKRSAATFYKWAVKNKNAIATMKFADVMGTIHDLGIDYHTWCTVD